MEYGSVCAEIGDCQVTYTIGIDIGGTCTDCVVISPQGDLILGKAFSTPPDFSVGIMDSLKDAAMQMGSTSADLLSRTALFLHSTSVAENALVDGTVAPAGMLMTNGFEEALSAMRGGYGRWAGLSEAERRDPITTNKPAPIVPLTHVYPLRERTDVHGEVLRHVDDADVEQALARFRELGVQAVGVCLLWAPRNPENERRVASILRNLAPDLFITASHEICSTLGEYERASTVALNAQLGPVVEGYARHLEENLRSSGFAGDILMMQTYGGLAPLEAAVARPVGMIESGPVSGVIGARNVGRMVGYDNVIAADMGGTTFKVGLVRDGVIDAQRDSMVLRYHYALPKLDITSLGLAGGSIISIDSRTGTPSIGPNSAGSYPGPVCYAHGGADPTVTDVDAILGYLHEDYFLGGRSKLNIDAARDVFGERVAGPLGLEVEDAAAQIYGLANNMMYDLLHKVTVERGIDPRRFVLCSFGGTAGMHVASYARKLGVAAVIVPRSASVHSAFGLATSDLVFEHERTAPQSLPVDLGQVNSILTELAGNVRAQLSSGSSGPLDVRLEYLVDMRYSRQVHILSAPLHVESGILDSNGVAKTLDDFEDLYRNRYGPGSGHRGAGVEMVTFRVRGVTQLDQTEVAQEELQGPNPAPAFVESRRVWTGDRGGFQTAPGYDLESLRPGNEVEGPALIWSPITTVVLHDADRAKVDGYGNLVISFGGSQ
jgi:N-methylhydantoinase A